MKKVITYILAALFACLASQAFGREKSAFEKSVQGWITNEAIFALYLLESPDDELQVLNYFTNMSIEDLEKYATILRSEFDQSFQKGQTSVCDKSQIAGFASDRMIERAIKQEGMRDFCNNHNLSAGFIKTLRTIRQEADNAVKGICSKDLWAENSRKAKSCKMVIEDAIVNYFDFVKEHPEHFSYPVTLPEFNEDTDKEEL